MMLPMLYPDRAIDELNRASKLPGMRGVYMGTHIDDTHDLDDPLFDPIYAHIEALGLPVFLHPLQNFGLARLQSYYLTNLLGNPFDTAIAASKLIFGGVMDRHPKLQINLPHGGGALPILIGRIDQGYRVRPEIKKMNVPRPPSEYLAALHLRYDRPLQADYGVRHSGSRRRARHDRERLLLRHGLRPALGVSRADQPNERAEKA